MCPWFQIRDNSRGGRVHRSEFWSLCYLFSSAFIPKTVLFRFMIFMIRFSSFIYFAHNAWIPFVLDAWFCKHTWESLQWAALWLGVSHGRGESFLLPTHPLLGARLRVRNASSYAGWLSPCRWLLFSHNLYTASFAVKMSGRVDTFASFLRLLHMLLWKNIFVGFNLYLSESQILFGK